MTSILFEQKCDFQFKGDRKYVHGTDMFDTMLGMVFGYFNSYPVSVNGALHRPLRNDANCMIYERSKVHYPEKYAAIFTVSVIGKDYDVLFVDNNSLICSSYEYDESQVLRGMQIGSDTLSLRCTPEYSLIEQYIALTRVLHKLTIPHQKGHWMFSRASFGEILEPANYQGGSLGVTLAANFQDKLTKTTLNLNGKSIGSVSFSIEL